MNTRNVIFSLAKPEDFEFNPDASEQDIALFQEQTREREGIFHCWQEVEEQSPCSENFIIKKVALIEDVTTGEIHEVKYNNLKFTK